MTPLLSIVIVYFDIPEQFRRTLFSLSPVFQQGVDPTQYEVIVVDNGSHMPLDISEATSLGMNVEVLRIEDASVSPVRAINAGLNASIAPHVGVMIDGARLVSANLIRTALRALRLADRCVVGSRGRYLGFKPQRESMLEGYNPSVETELLASVDWKNHPDRLFDISVFDESSGYHWTDPISESNSLFMSRHLWRELGGYSPRFEAPGGGYVNLDTWRRACLLPDVLPVVLLGEATFHQIHGGVATNGPQNDIDRMHDEYRVIRGDVYSPPDVELHFFGALSASRGILQGTDIGDFPHLEATLRVLESQLLALESSTSWRLTEPLRKIKQVFAAAPILPAVWPTLSLRQRRQFLQERIDAILQSRSWRLTEPLRLLSNRWRRR